MKSITIPLHFQLSFKDETFYQAQTGAYFISTNLSTHKDFLSKRTKMRVRYRVQSDRCVLGWKQGHSVLQAWKLIQLGNSVIQLEEKLWLLGKMNNYSPLG